MERLDCAGGIIIVDIGVVEVPLTDGLICTRQVRSRLPVRLLQDSLCYVAQEDVVRVRVGRQLGATVGAVRDRHRTETDEVSFLLVVNGSCQGLVL